MNPSLVAAMVSRDDIQRLIHRQDAGRKVISLFLDMSVNSDNKRTYGVFLSKQRSRFAELDSDREAHHREALGEAFSRIERWIEDNFDEANKGLAIYAEIGGRWIAGYQVAVPLQNRFEIAERPLIGPLAEVVECHPLYGVVVLDRDSLPQRRRSSSPRPTTSRQAAIRRKTTRSGRSRSAGTRSRNSPARWTTSSGSIVPSISSSWGSTTT
jgi:hypothetical protein